MLSGQVKDRLSGSWARLEPQVPALLRRSPLAAERPKAPAAKSRLPNDFGGLPKIKKAPSSPDSSFRGLLKYLKHS